MLSTDSDGVLVSIRITPRAPATRIAGERGGRLLIQVTAPPLDGRANDAVRRLLAKSLKIATGRIRVVSGERARDKLIRIEGVSAPDVARALRLRHEAGG